eukprot:g2874.t1
MSVREVASAEFYQLSRRAGGKLLVVQFTATWCGPCRRVAPQYEALARRTPDVEFIKVYEHNSRDAIIASGVRSFPTFHFYLGGAKVDECRGARIAQVEQKVNQHKGAASAAAGPVMVKLRFEREKPRESGNGFVLVAEEAELEVHASEGLEIFRFQVLSMTDIETDQQCLTAGDSTTPMATDADLAAGLKRTGGGVYGNYPVIRVSKRPAGAGGASPGAASAETAGAKKPQGAAGPPDWKGCCSRTFFGRKPVVQPAYVIREESVLPENELTNLQKKKAGPEALLVVCKACAENCFVPGRAEHSPAISTSSAFVCQSKEACGKGYGADLFSDRADTGAEVLAPGSSGEIAALKDAAAAADDVYYAARGLLRAGGGENGQMADMRARVASGMARVLAYEDAALQRKARAVLPPDGDGAGGSISQRGAEMVAAGGFSEEEGLARALLSWFKKDFFKWTNKPPCSACGARGGNMQGKGECSPTPEEASAKASRVELYVCKDCGAETRFPRYNDPAKLLETRNGRCGEFANCFTLLCRTVGLEARCAMDWTDHVWTEIWIPAKSKWVHADPCENKLDKPLMYEQGWNKRLSYVIAFDKNGAVDVTRRYTRRWLQVLSRRNNVPEKWLVAILAGSSTTRTEATVARLAQEQRELKEYESMGCDGDNLDSEEKEGRQSGDAEWVASRGEDGSASALPGPARSTSSNSQTTGSPLVGAPLGVLQAPAGGGASANALCVAAVVERSGDASVLVGGATASRLSGRGRGALCAVAVSSASGILLAAKTFVLGGEGSSAEVTAWLAGLPEGTVVAIAAGGGGPENGPALDAGLAEALAGLAEDVVPDAAATESTPGNTKSRAFALVGWKGPGRREWARRQHRASGPDSGGGGGGGRTALYAELLLAPPDLTADQAAISPKQVELQDKLCVCPLRSAPGDETLAPAAPARGFCRREGEPTVSVGPAVDLVDCPGWTTTLQAPLESNAVSPPAAWMVTSVIPAVGETHEDTEEFDDGPVGCPAFIMGGSPVNLPNGGGPFLPIGRVREVVVWSGDNVNGIQLVYDVEGDTVRGPKRMGDHGLYRQSKLVLDVEDGEVVTEISVKAGALVDSLRIKTSKGQEKKWGGDGGHLQQTWRVPAGSSFLGFHGGVGGHLHSLGVTLAETRGDTKTGGSGRNLLEPVVKTKLYSTDRVKRACAQFLAFNSTTATGGGEGGAGPPGNNPAPAPEEVVTALETMRKYADNLLASPLDPKVSRIRLGNGFFDRKIGRLPGGGGVVRAMGFELADEGGRMHYVFRREGAGGGLQGLRRARQTLVDFVGTLKPSVA